MAEIAAGFVAAIVANMGETATLQSQI